MRLADRLAQGDNVSGQSAAVLNEVLTLLGDDDPVSRIAQDVTTGIVSSLVNGVSNQLYSVAVSDDFAYLQSMYHDLTLLPGLRGQPQPRVSMQHGSVSDL